MIPGSGQLIPSTVFYISILYSVFYILKYIYILYNINIIYLYYIFHVSLVLLCLSFLKLGKFSSMRSSNMSSAPFSLFSAIGPL